MLGKLISFEGPEGSGKTSVIQAVGAHFQSLGYDVLISREPGGIPIAEAIRNIILDVEHTALDPMAEAMLFAASRRQHVMEVIEPAIQQGKMVLVDRYIDSSLAYQGVGRDLGVDRIFNLNKMAINGYLPALTVFIDVHPDEGLKRIAHRQHELDRLDRETVTFHHKVYQGYQDLLRQEPQRIKKVNGEQPMDAVARDAIALIQTMLKEG
jgi:dTMP kinase